MNILFLTMSATMKGVDSPGIYTDLMRQFFQNGHNVYIIAPAEKRTGEQTNILRGDGWTLLRVRTGNVQKSSTIEKGIAQMQIQGQFLRGIWQYFQGIQFDLIMYSTPPITFSNLICKLKKVHHARTYLLLKDIFPQNAVDLGMMTMRGLKSPIYWYFRHMEKQLYAVSDHIGCMSQANVDYVLKHNPEIDPARVEICPNSVEVRDLRVTAEVRNTLRKKYGIPLNKKVFVYGGNLGKPQGIPFIIECLKSQMDNPEAFFLVVGDGTEYKKLEAFFDNEKPANMKLMKRLPKEDYDAMVAACDVGLIFLDHRFTIPNFPSRVLSCMQAGLPVLCCTDPNTDIGKVCEEGGFGWWCESNDVEAFGEQIRRALSENLSVMGERGFAFMQEHYCAERSCQIIMEHFGGQ